jgi:endonuclease YncB( thermonuclease family)
LTLGVAATLPGRIALAAEEIRGEAKVVSGNEIRVGKRVVRLFGMTAPGLDDLCSVSDAKLRCGIVAWAELIKLADGRYISCDVETKAEGAVFATCYISEADLNEALVRSGWARAAPDQTDRYVVDEADAQESQRGLWSNYKPSKKKAGKKKR